MNKNAKLQAWVDEVAKMCQPDSISWCDGSAEENDRLLKMMVDSGTAIPLSPEKRPGCYLFRSDASDVARVENRTFIASVDPEKAGPTNNWVDPKELKRNHERSVHRLHERPYHVRHSFLDGPRSARRSPRSVLKSPTVPTLSSICGS